jgi:hypothetical protein
MLETFPRERRHFRVSEASMARASFRSGEPPSALPHGAERVWMLTLAGDPRKRG